MTTDPAAAVTMFKVTGYGPEVVPPVRVPPRGWGTITATFAATAADKNGLPADEASRRSNVSKFLGLKKTKPVEQVIGLGREVVTVRYKR